MLRSSDLLPPALVRLVRCFAVIGLMQLASSLGLIVSFLIVGAVDWAIPAGLTAVMLILTGQRIYASANPGVIRGFSMIGVAGSFLFAVALAAIAANHSVHIIVWLIGAPACLMIWIIIREVTAYPHMP